jgi:hypothetical protein
MEPWRLKMEPRRITIEPWRQCWGSMTFWCGYGSADPYLLLMDPDLDLTPFYYFYYLLKNLIFCKIFVIKFYFAGIVSVLSTHL